MNRTRRIRNVKAENGVKASIHVIEEYENEYARLLRQEQCDGTIDSLTSPSLERKKRRLEEMIKEEKEEVVKAVTCLSFHEATEKNPKSFWYTFLSDMTKPGGRRKVTASTEEDLVDKVFLILSSGSAFTGNLSNATFREVFEKGFERKSAGNCTANTLRKLRADYNRFILGTPLEHMKVKFIEDVDLMSHTKRLLESKDFNKSAFMAYKGVLNVAFDLAVDKRVILDSPAKKIGNKNYYSLLTEVHRTRSDGSTVPNGSDGKIHSEEEIEALKNIAWADIKRRYANYAYATIASILTGMRTGELFSLKWSDVDFDNGEVWIHSQQLCKYANKHYTFEYVPWTKNERKLDVALRTGRHFPLYDELRDLLERLKEDQEERGIRSEYVFANLRGEWGRTRNYERYLKHACERLGFEVTNNHALRMSLNSNVFITKLGMLSPMRAELLGHSVEVNERYYSHRPKNNVEKAADIFAKKLGNSK